MRCGNNSLGFSRFGLANSSIRYKVRRRVATAFTLHKIITSSLLVSLPGKKKRGKVLTALISLQPFLHTYSIKQIRMLSQSEAKVFLAAERGCTQTDTFRSYHTFKFGTYEHEHKKPFGALYVLNDETLAGGQSVHLAVQEDTLVLALPLVGGIVAGSNETESQFVHAGQLQFLFLKSGSAYTIRNPFEGELVNYLQLWIRYPLPLEHTSGVISFDIDEKKNTLITLFPAEQKNSLCLKASIGKFDGRKEAIYSLLSNDNRVMVFVVQGAFEIENRLLEARDGLALWNTAEIELEALSNEALVLFLEIKEK